MIIWLTTLVLLLMKVELSPACREAVEIHAAVSNQITHVITEKQSLYKVSY